MNLLKPLTVFIGLLLIWQTLVWITGVPPYILPGPQAVAKSFFSHINMILRNTWITALEILAGIGLGTWLGCLSALILSYFSAARRWLLPVLVASQAIPVFAIAPLLVLWLGYGMASKIAMATLIIYFPVTTNFYDGLRRTQQGWLEMAHIMAPKERRWTLLRHIAIPAALPALASGLRVAVSVAPIGAVVGEWVGSSAGLGYLMLHANGRMEIDLMFAALFTLALLAIALYFTVDSGLKYLMPWQTEITTPGKNIHA